MIQMSFFIRFKPQLQRTRSDLISILEARTVLAVKQAGGQITRDQGLIQAVFDENSFGFWIDMLLFIEIIKQITEDAAEDLYGYTLLLGINSLAKPESLCRIMAGGPGGGGVFMDQTVARAMQPYITSESREKWEPEPAAVDCGAYARLKEIKIIVPAARNGLPFGKAGAFPNGLEQNSSILYTGRALKGRRTEIYLQTASFSQESGAKEIPPLFVRFGGGGLCALTDSYARWMRPLPDWIPAEKEKEINGIWEFLFRERLRKTPSPYAVRKAGEFFDLLLGLYCDIAQNAGKPPAVVLENINIAEKDSAEIVIGALNARQNIHLLGICPVEISSVSLSQWKPLFSRVINVSADFETTSGPQYPGIPFDLWELGYVCSLLGTYFPPEYIPLLLEESGKSPAMISRTISLLQTVKIIDTALDPRPWNEQFMDQAEAALGEKIKILKAHVCGRLLAWVEQKKINPCISLLKIMVKLGAADNIDDSLLLRSIHNELSATNGLGLEKAVEKRIFRIIAGQEREDVIRYIAGTLLALHSGSGEMIRGAFAVQPPEGTAFPMLQTRVQINQALYSLGIRGNDQALETAKKAAIICQKNNSPCLAMSYRLMALASLSHKRINETINYLGFALENAVIAGEPHEIGMAGYYTASMQLLYGNLSLSRKYAEKARGHFLEAGSPRWADRSRFLEGRLDFEAGYYQKAADIFEDMLKNPNGENGSEKQNLIEAWAYRARNNGHAAGQTGGYDASRPKPEGLDAGLFRLEALYLAGEYAKMEELSEELSTIPIKDDFIHAEQPDWHSGFSQCELLFFSRADLWERMFGVWRSLAQCRLSPQKAAEAQIAMQKALKKNQFPEIDTCDPFYYYALYQTLEHSGASQVDIRTAASAAFTRLQNRAGKIDDSGVRHQYLKQPHWSRALCQAAAEFKLV
jgi:tetratricopeptide (TPR) repeat protein